MKHCILLQQDVAGGQPFLLLIDKTQLFPDSQTLPSPELEPNVCLSAVEYVEICCGFMAAVVVCCLNVMCVFFPLSFVVTTAVHRIYFF